MTTYIIRASWGEICRFHADLSDSRTFVDALQEAVYVAWEMELEDRCTTAQFAALLKSGWPILFSYHGLEFAWLRFDGAEFSLTE